MKHFCITWLAFCSVALAQNTAPQGVLQQWEVQQLLQDLETQAKHLGPVIDQVKPEDWVAKGASETYLAQTKNSKAELKYLLGASDALIKQPERLTLALDAYFRMLSLERTLRPVLEGVRSYQGAALANQIQDVINENSNNRDKLRQYVQDLAVQKEAEFAVADREAQRCRGVLAKQPAAPAPQKRKN